jgi:hypothetical protein
MVVINVVSVYICSLSSSSVLPNIIVAVAAAVLFEFCEELENPSNVSVCVKTF